MCNIGLLKNISHIEHTIANLLKNYILIYKYFHSIVVVVIFFKYFIIN